MLCALLVAMLVSPQAGVIADAPPTTTPAATSSASPVENPKVTALAKSQFIAFQQGKINKALYSPAAQSGFTDAIITQASQALAPLGDVKSLKLITSQQISSPPDTAYIYLVTCDKGTIQETLVLTADGLIDGLYFRAA